MYMDDGEIIREYKAAKNPKEQVGILADLNGVDRKEMTQWLFDHGQKVDKRLLAAYTGSKKEASQPIPDASIPNSMKVYIAGPITDNPNYAIEFCEVETWLREHGFEPVNPARNVEESYKGYIDTGLKQLMSCDMICLLDGWSDSDGASLEWDYACTVEMPELTLPEKVLQRIQKMIKTGSSK